VLALMSLFTVTSVYNKKENCSRVSILENKHNFKRCKYLNSSPAAVWISLRYRRLPWSTSVQQIFTKPTPYTVLQFKYSILNLK
jgi:hypothetical protein